ncbi:MAG TPA: hypothetical protein VKD90_26895, partial [Gemmataceae bacterium]|nr:hypothetical protein [Gemmataceae bacterium]
MRTVIARLTIAAVCAVGLGTVADVALAQTPGTQPGQTTPGTSPGTTTPGTQPGSTLPGTTPGPGTTPP